MNWRFGIARRPRAGIADLSFAAQRCYRRRWYRTSWDFRLSKSEKNDWREGRKEERSAPFNVFVITANSPTASWERFCVEQTRFTMPKLKIDEERPVFLRNTGRILFPEIICPVTSCQHHQNCIARHILLAMKTRRNREKISKFHLLFLYLYFNDPLNKYQYSIYNFAAVCIYQLTSKLANLSKDKK